MSHSNFNPSSRSKYLPSGSPKPNAYHYSRVPSDHESEGNIPITVSSGSNGGGREVASTPESSKSGTVVSTSGLVVLESPVRASLLGSKQGRWLG